MKKYILYIFFCCISLTMFNSCADYFGDVNVDPDNPISVTPDAILPQVQTRLSYTLWGDISRYISLNTTT